MEKYFNPYDKIDKIEIKYYRKDLIEDSESSAYTEDSYEEVIIDRYEENISYKRKLSQGIEVDQNYHVEMGVSEFLDSFSPGIFSEAEGHYFDPVKNPTTSNLYIIRLISEKGNNREVVGSFDKEGLPKDYKDFIESLYNFLSYYGVGDIFDEDLYEKVFRRQGELIVCGVIFKNSYKSYFYLTDDDDLCPGDFVLVPTGKDNLETVGQIATKGYYLPENMPYPLDNIKKIIRRCSLSDFQ
ncbi:MAG: hypothetical protein SPI59_06885 [Finegoldia sp.]|nr:hypothetical protein [Finegoldia sp.]